MHLNACVPVLLTVLLLTPAFSSAQVTDAVPAAASNTIAAPAPADAEPEEEYVSTRVLAARLTTNDVAVLLETIEQIGEQDSGSRYVLDEFARLLAHPSNDVKQAVLDAVFGFDSVRGLLAALEVCLSDENETIREDAADVLGEIETRQMIDVFVRHLDSPHEDVRDNAEFYLLFWTDESYTNAAEWVTWWESNKTTFVFE
jgi:HEAT repeat protein